MNYDHFRNKLWNTQFVMKEQMKNQVSRVYSHKVDFHNFSIDTQNFMGSNFHFKLIIQLTEY